MEYVVTYKDVKLKKLSKKSLQTHTHTPAVIYTVYFCCISMENLVNINETEDINRAWENLKENVKISTKEMLGLYESKQHKSWLDEECL